MSKFSLVLSVGGELVFNHRNQLAKTCLVRNHTGDCLPSSRRVVVGDLDFAGPYAAGSGTGAIGGSVYADLTDTLFSFTGISYSFTRAPDFEGANEPLALTPLIGLNGAKVSLAYDQPAPVETPEPAALGLMALGALAICSRRQLRRSIRP